ncbi:MAG TPA: cell division protein FtsH, partial [Chloroflexota bacterium]
ADLANLLNEAAILAARRNLKAIGLPELEEAVDRVMAGPARTSRVVAPRDREIVAYHEAGHAVVARYLHHLDPLHKVMIVPRGTAGGYTRLLPVEDRYYHSRTELEQTIAFTLGGRVAEEIVFAEISTGASNDIQESTRLARYMVSTLGMSDRLGPIALARRSGSIFLGRGVVEPALHSKKTTEAIDDEIRAVVDAGMDRARAILVAHGDVLARLAHALLEQESISGEELERVFRIEPGAALAGPSPA